MSAYFRAGEKTNFRHRSSIKMFPRGRRFNIFQQLPPQTPYSHTHPNGSTLNSDVSENSFIMVVYEIFLVKL